MKDFLKSLLGNVLSGESLVKQLGDVADRFITTKEEKAEFEKAIRELAHKQELDLAEIAHQADVEFNTRIKDLEGTAKDLLQAGWLGKIVLFLRGSQRSLWGYGTFYFNLMYFSGRLSLTHDGESLLYIIDVLVLGFLFGERAVKNVAPLVKDIIDKKRSNQN